MNVLVFSKDKDFKNNLDSLNLDYYKCKNLPIYIIKNSEKLNNLNINISQNKIYSPQNRQINDYQWGLSRINSESLNIKNIFNVDRTGSKSDIYLLDTGISKHKEFNNFNRIFNLFDYRTTLNENNIDYIDNLSNEFGIDYDGHGTYIASIIGGVTCGIATSVKFYNCKVFNRLRQSTTEWLILALDEILTHHISKLPININYRPSIINCSFITQGNDDILELAINECINLGCIVIAAAGNNNTFSTYYTPANIDKVITVASTTIDDNFANHLYYNFENTNTLSGNLASNYGDLIDILAPGVNVYGANLNNEYQVLSGTSVSCAFVSGVVSLYLDLYNTSNYIDVKNHLIDNSTKNKIKNLELNTKNNLLRNVFDKSSIYFLTDELPSVNENTAYKFEIKAESKNNSNGNDIVNFRVINGTLPPGINLSKFGILEGISPDINPNMDNYIFINSLPIEEQSLYEFNQKGFINYTFDIEIYTIKESLVKTFNLKVIDLNIAPEWNYNLPKLLNNIYGDFKVINLNLSPLELTEIDFKNDFNFISDLDIDNIKITLLNGILPLGLEPRKIIIDDNIELDYSYISGYIENFTSINNETERDFTFTLRAYDGKAYVDRTFIIKVKKVSENNSIPLWVTDSFLQNSLGTFKTSDIVNIQLDAIDYDNDNLTFKLEPIREPLVPNEILPVECDPFNNSYIYHRLPDGLIVTETGKIVGDISINNCSGTYYFQVSVSDLYDSNSRVFKIIIEKRTEYYNSINDNLIWITPEGLLGEFNETYPINSFVVATSLNNNVKYRLISELPSIIKLTEDGFLYGNMPYVNKNTEYEFLIEAYTEDTSSIRKFILKNNNIFKEQVSEINCVLSGLDKLEFIIQNFSNNIPKEYIYREFDDNYGIQGKHFIYIHGGIQLLTNNQIFDIIKNDINDTSFKDFHFVLGDLKYKPFYRNNNYEYDLIYYEIYEPNKNYTVNFSYNNKNYYSSDIQKWKNIFLNYTKTIERKPEWMDDFTLSIPLIYLKAGLGKNVLNLLNSNSFNKLKNTKIYINKIMYNILNDSNDKFYFRFIK